MHRSNKSAKQGFQWTADTFGAFNLKNKEEIVNENELPEDALTNRTIEYINEKHTQPCFNLFRNS